MKPTSLLLTGIALLGTFSAAAQDYPVELTYMAQNIEAIQKAMCSDDYFDRPVHYTPDRYQLLDIDDDGKQELWVRSGNNEEGALFTFENGKPKLVTHENYKMRIGINGNLVTVGGSAGTGAFMNKYYIIENSKAIEAPFIEIEEALPDDNVKTYYISGDDDNYPASKAKAFLKRAKRTHDFDPDDMGWDDFKMCGIYLNASTDITLRERPIFVEPEIEKNKFVALSEKKIADASAYNRMIFKPHVGNVTFTGNLGQDNELYRYGYKLNDPGFTKKMFRGYKSDEACPVVVKESFLRTHNPLQFSRWKYPEQEVGLGNDYSLKQLRERYDNRRIKAIRWIASCEANERMFYAVQFEDQGGIALGSVVCFAEGELVSAWDDYAELRGEEAEAHQSVWHVDDQGEYLDIAPSIHCMMATSAGLELYVVRYGAESYSTMILREIGDQFICIQDDYHYIHY